jgi:hypothetical protein
MTAVENLGTGLVRPYVRRAPGVVEGARKNAIPSAAFFHPQASRINAVVHNIKP